MNSSDIAISYSPEISYEEDLVRGMIAEAFCLLGLDREHYGTTEWTPLGEYIHPGDKVLVKPNLVMHMNPSGEGTECLYTQTPVVEAVLGFVLTALKGKGSIIVGDAPMQGCCFEELAEQSGYKEMVERFRKRGTDIVLRDFRNTVSETINGVVVEKELRKNGSVLVDVGRNSSFIGCSEEKIRNLRVTNYDPRILQEHHASGKHEYLVAKEILDADVIINMPKPKTHRKAGMTGALKNLVGINCNKEYLPHHTRQSKDIKGDAFLHSGFFLRLVDDFADKKCVAEKRYHYKEALFYRYAGGLCGRIGRKMTHEKYSEGSWYGNDTIWRTILDLNKILQYADKDGHICAKRQRRFFNVGDMIISGENDGPVSPSRKESGIIVAGEDPCSFDEVVTALMGFDGEKIPTVKQMRLTTPEIYFSKKYKIVSNNSVWDKKTADEICEEHSLGFVPNPGWEEVL